MLSIRRLAEYVGVTPRAIRHYHALGLLPEPERTASGYRSYHAQDIIDLQRIKVLTDAGVPLARVRELLDADQPALRAAVTELDADLAQRIAALQRTRRSLATLASGEDPFLPPELAAMQARMRELGVSEQTLAADRDGWILVQALYPEALSRWMGGQLSLLDDPGYRELYLLIDRAANWEPEDPRIEDLAQRTVAWTRALGAGTHEPETEEWEVDTVGYHLITTYRRDTSPGWRRFMERVEELAQDAGMS